MNTPEQQFSKGDLVQLASEFPSWMSHFSGIGCRAVVQYSYKERYGGSVPNGHNYSLWIEGKGSGAWYDEPLLTLIEHGRQDLLDTWEQNRKDDKERRSDLDWIFSQWKGAPIEDCMKGFDGVVAQALYTTLGGGSLWGSRGEGITYFTNQMKMFEIAAPFLIAGDREGFLALTPGDESVE